MRFQVYQVSLEVNRSLRQPLVKIRTCDPKLFGQIRGVASSVPMNIAEGNRRSGKDRPYHFRVAAGSAAEVRSALEVLEAWGDLDPRDGAPTLKLIDRVLAMLWKLTR